MNTRPFHIERIKISTMPGFPDGLHLPESFSPQINIITGPNGSGKSSLARALLEAIWQHNRSDYSLRAHAQSAEGSWSMVLRYGRVELQRDGQPNALTGIPAAEDRGRYLLALHELVAVQDQDLADEIRRQLSGGYNLDLALSDLGFNASVSTKAISEYKALKAAQKVVESRERSQLDVQREAEKRGELQKRRDDLKKQLRREKGYQALIELRRSEDELDSIALALKDFPEQLEKMHEDDLTNFDAWQNQLSTLDEELRELDAEQKELEKRVEALKLPQDGLSADQVSNIAGAMKTIENNAALQREKELQVVRAAEKRRSAEEILRLASNEEAWSGPTAGDFALVGAHWELAFRNRTARERAAAEKRQLEEKYAALDAPLAPLETIQGGVQVLSSWLLDTGTAAAPQKHTYLWVLAILAVLAAVAATFVPWNGLPLLVAGVAALLLFLALKKQKPVSADQRPTFQVAYERLELPRPEAWTVQGVTDCITLLLKAQKAAQDRENMQAFRDKATKDFVASDEAYAKSMEKLADTLAAVRLLKQEDENLPELYWLVKHFSDWKDANTEVNALTAERNRCEDAVQKGLQALNQVLSGVQRPAVDASEWAQSAAKKLLDDQADFEKWQSQIKGMTRLIAEKQKSAAQVKDKLNDVYSRLGCTPGDRNEIADLASKRPAFIALREEQRNVTRDRERAKSKVETFELSQNELAELDSISTPDLEARIEEVEQQREERDRLIADISKIDGDVDRLSRGHDLEGALGEREAAFEALEEAFRSNLSTMTGHVVAEVLREEFQSNNESALFQRSDILFRKITQQRYKLLVPSGRGNSFRALDQVSKTGVGLDELSTGTRIQLLLAVRLAYIETIEQHYRLPLLADELLANSDDERAQAIIAALVEICRDGRQVFYFTAQEDEVVKWQQFLAETDRDFKVIALDGKAGKLIDFTERPQPTHPELPATPAPDNKSHTDYGAVIGVPRFDLMRHPVSQLHLWYIVDDTEVLYRLLQSRVAYWGVLATLQNDPLPVVSGDWRVHFDHWSRRVRFIERLIDLYKQGRPQQVDRKALEESGGAVSENFIDEADLLLQELNGNPEALLQALENKAISGFRSNKIEELQAYFQSLGVLAGDAEPLQRNELLDRAYGIGAALNLDTTEIKRLFDRLLPEEALA